MKHLITITGFLLLANTTLAFPIQYKDTAAECQPYWDMLENPIACHLNSEIDAVKHAFEYEKAERKKAGQDVSSVTKQSDFIYDIEFDYYSTNTPDVIDSEAGFASTTPLVYGGLGAILLAIIASIVAWFRRKK